MQFGLDARNRNKRSLFKLGQTLSTPGALDALGKAGVTPSDLLQRHITGDWGDTLPEDRDLNEEALVMRTRIFSAYLLPHTGEKIWIFTEADRSATTLLLPEEY